MSVIARNLRIKQSQLTSTFLLLDDQHKCVDFDTEFHFNSNAEDDKSEVLLAISVFTGKAHSLFNLKRT